MLLAVVVTAIGLVLLLSFKPHDVAGVAQPPAAIAQTQDPGNEAPATHRPAGDRAFDGDVADTRWGPVQVRITVTDGKIADIEVLRSPDGNRRDIEINDRALPILRQETMSAQSAQIDSVSGASYTSDGYIRSLQSAIDRAGL
ncbi:FMN-binding protein [Nonomuraea sp. M3C6]|uniref:FMN-binding protein n=1 Tax=Nonomuraea marmarensis TaxID=3351344 RepID=A0ABW7AA66_9ACTN